MDDHKIHDPLVVADVGVGSQTLLLGVFGEERLQRLIGGFIARNPDAT
jgi:hypothetical protein